MTSPDIAALDKEEGVLILPIGAIEQHGPHLPTITDTIITTHILDATLAQWPADVRAVDNLTKLLAVMSRFEVPGDSKPYFVFRIAYFVLRIA